MNFKKDESTDKLRGGYYTPIEIARFLAQWVMIRKPKNVLEPSCGDGNFIAALEGLHNYKISVTAIELIESEANKTALFYGNKPKISLDMKNMDFLDYFFESYENNVLYDAVIGNPPYIRYQYLEAYSQELAKKIFKTFHLSFTKHTNAWVPFIIASVALLKPGGRLAMVVPSEILHVLHAESLRTYLLQECDKILIIDPTELLFKNVLQGTVLLMVEKKYSKKDASRGVAIMSAPDNSFLTMDPEKIFREAHYVSGDLLNGKWMKILLTQEELEVFEKAKSLNQVHKFSNIASVDVGIVTGANKFFLVPDDIVEKYQLQKYALPMFGRSDHCPGIVYDVEVHKKNKKKGLPTNFLLFGDDPKGILPKSVQNYIKLGENEGLQKRYKCRIRHPWYKVPSVYHTEIGMLKRSHNFPKLILNTMGAYTTDTAYRIKIIDTNIKAEKIVFCFINSLTALSAEMEGRHYGGGVLELVPSEIEKVLVPLPSDIYIDIKSLDDKIKSSYDINKLLEEQDDKILSAIGLNKKERTVLHSAWKRIKQRRQRYL